MVTKKNGVSKNEIKTNRTPQKKATTGAWWKSSEAVDDQPAKENEQVAGAERAASSPKTKVSARRKARKKSTGKAASQSTTASSVKSEEKKSGTKSDTEQKNTEKSVEELEKKSRKIERSAAKRTPRSRSKKKSEKKAEFSEEVDVLPVGNEAPVSTADENLDKDKPVSKKRGRPGKSVKKDVSQSDPVEQSATKVVDEKDRDAAEEERERKVSRSRRGRKKKSAEIPDGQQSAESTITDGEDREQDQIADTDQRGRLAGGRKKIQDSAKEEKELDKPAVKPVIKLLINAEEPEECRLALLEDGRLESIHVATTSREQTKNNIYKGRIVAIEPNLQVAFVDYGTEKNGFLPFSEIHPEYYKDKVTDKVQKYIDQHQWKKLSIDDVMEKDSELLVQVVKEEVGKKGANMTTYLSIPGRCAVLMPGSDSTGISRKISGEEKRSQLREYMSSMNIPEGIGWIIRTASNDITKTVLSRDVNYLMKLWADIKKKGQELDGVGLIYQDHDHVLRFLREHFDPDIQEILVDSEEALKQVEGFVELLPAKQRKVKCKLHSGSRPIFNQYSIEDQIESIYKAKVNLPSGGSIVIDPTEALVAIDVNSGSTQKGANFEETIFQANMEAAQELARQLRLRDLGGLIVVDFIDMRQKKNIRDVERQVKQAMKRDKAKVDTSCISKFGLMQISRQKLGAPIEAGNYRVCEHCNGRGTVRSVETQALFYLRRIHTGASRKAVVRIECRFPLDIASYLLNNKRTEIEDLEKKYECEVFILGEPLMKPSDNEIIFHKVEK